MSDKYYREIKEIPVSAVPPKAQGGAWDSLYQELSLRMEATPKTKALEVVMFNRAVAVNAQRALSARFKKHDPPVKVERRPTGDGGYSLFLYFDIQKRAYKRKADPNVTEGD